MSGAPWRHLQYEGAEIIIDVDGNVTANDITARPFPTEITQAAICNSGLVATWVDHELRLARMALIDVNEKLVDGISRSALRISESNTPVAGSIWSHTLDAEPIALASNGEHIVFALYTRGVYCIKCDSTELWRQPIIGSEESKLPGQNSISALTINDEHVVIWTRGGTYRVHSLEDGEMISENSLGVDCDVENVFCSENRYLISSRDGWAWELVDGQITVARKLRGTIQDALFHEGEWRIISWREDIILSKPETSKRVELGVQLVIEEGKCLVLDNQGTKSAHMG